MFLFEFSCISLCCLQDYKSSFSLSLSFSLFDNKMKDDGNIRYLAEQILGPQMSYGGHPEISQGAADILDGKKQPQLSPQEEDQVIRDALIPKQSPMDEAMVWTEEELKACMAGKLDWWPAEAVPKDNDPVKQHIGCDGWIKLSRRLCRACRQDKETLEALHWKLKLAGVDPSWRLNRTLIIVGGSNIAGHGFGLALYVSPGTERLESSYILLNRL